MAEGAFKQFAKTELVKVCEPLYIFIINIEILYEDIVSVPLVVGEFLIGPQKKEAFLSERLFGVLFRKILGKS